MKLLKKVLVFITCLILISSCSSRDFIPNNAKAAIISTDPLSPGKPITSIRQLSDVEPDHWAFESVQSLVERYGSVEGYSDSTFRGDRAATRYEIAYELNASLDRINELIAAAVADIPSKGDLATIRRLVQEFADAIATTRRRTDSFEARLAGLEGRIKGRLAKLEATILEIESTLARQN